MDITYIRLQNQTYITQYNHTDIKRLIIEASNNKGYLNDNILKFINVMDIEEIETVEITQTQAKRIIKNDEECKIEYCKSTSNYITLDKEKILKMCNLSESN